MIQSKKQLNFYIHQDRLANSKQVSSFISNLKKMFAPDLIMRYLGFLRKAEFYFNCRGNNLFYRFLAVYYKYRLRNLGIKLGYSIPINVCGPGLSLPHFGTIIVNSNAKIGANCRIHACVNIGASGGSKTAPVLGDNVYIGPSAVLFGDIQIADNITIGANATVNKSCEQKNVVLAGSPAVVVKENYPSWIEFNNVKSLL